MKKITALESLGRYLGAGMSEFERAPVYRESHPPRPMSRVAYLLESLAIVLIAALAAYAAS